MVKVIRAGPGVNEERVEAGAGGTRLTAAAAGLS